MLRDASGGLAEFEQLTARFELSKLCSFTSRLTCGATCSNIDFITTSSEDGGSRAVTATIAAVLEAAGSDTGTRYTEWRPFVPPPEIALQNNSEQREDITASETCASKAFTKDTASQTSARPSTATVATDCSCSRASLWRRTQNHDQQH